VACSRGGYAGFYRSRRFFAIAHTGEKILHMRDGSVRLWQMEQEAGRTIIEKAVYSRDPSKDGSNLLGMRSVAFSPDGNLLAAAGHGPSIYVWKTDGASAPLHVLNGQAEIINTVAFGRDSSTLITAGDDGVVRFWDLDHKIEVRTIKTPKPVIRAAVSSDLRYLAVSSGAGFDELTETFVYDFSTGKVVRRFAIKHNQGDVIWSHAFSPDNRFLAIGTLQDNMIHLFSLEQEQEMWAIPFNNGDGIKDLVFSHNGKFLLAGVSLDAPYLIDAQSGAILKRYGGSTCDFKKY